MIRVLLCDDAVAFGFLFEAWMEDCKDIAMVGHAADASEAVSLAMRHTPRCHRARSPASRQDIARRCPAPQRSRARNAGHVDFGHAAAGALTDRRRCGCRRLREQERSRKRRSATSFAGFGRATP